MLASIRSAQTLVLLRAVSLFHVGGGSLHRVGFTVSRFVIRLLATSFERVVDMSLCLRAGVRVRDVHFAPPKRGSHLSACVLSGAHVAG